MINTARELGIGNLCIGHKPLAKEPLTEEDWGEVLRGYLAFQHHLKLLVLNARKRIELEPNVLQANYKQSIERINNTGVK
jgi:hypothetical protein